MLEANPNCPIRRRLANIPWVGDNRAGLRHWLEIQRDPLAWLQKMHAMQPDVAVMRMGPQRVWCLFHPQAVHELMVEHRDDLRRWTPALCMLKQWNGRSFMMREGEPAQAQRKAVRPHLVAPQASDVRRLAAQWADRIEEGREYDLDLEMAAFSVTLSGHALFDVDLEPTAYRIAKAVRLLSRVALLEMSTGLPLGHWFPSKLCPRKRWALGQLRAVVDEVVEHSPRPLVEMRDELCTLLMASHQSTGVTLTWCLLLLAQRPELCKQLRAELAPVDWTAIRSLSDLRNCPLLRAVLQESLRLYPPAYGLVPRQVSADIEVSGHSFKRGDVVMVSSWITHRDPRWFEEPLEFRPERFMDSATWPRGAYFPFGLGDRSCPGTAMAMIDLAASLAYWVEHWDIVHDGELVPRGWFSLRPQRARVRFVRVA
ncbi:cytochrome P450 [Pseudomonas cichorii]|uniref:cytochrome P450 n=1 Tax=Pseudomonas cichorii TaxID=36746 RepID=UPI0018E622A4|nr:cytochrome P450 [Pseudomonas cichorii]MBI6852033.1 cytochrome P450 [Pseudomonas cichorii]